MAPSPEIETLRQRSVAALGHRLGVAFAPHTGRKRESLFVGDDGTRLCAIPSKHYPERAHRAQDYWYTSNPRQHAFLEGGADTHMALSCEGLPHAYRFGYGQFKQWAGLEPQGRQHIYIATENARYYLHFGTADSPRIPLEDYELPLGNGAPLGDAPGASRLGVAEQTAAPPSSRLGAAEPPSSLSAATPHGRPGPRPTDAIARSLVVRDMSGPCFTYAMQFGARQVWKIGISKSLLQRRKDANWFVPHEVLNEQWRVARQIQHATGKEAYEMEQAILNQAKTKNLKQKNERIQCTEAELDELWNEALPLPLRGRG